MTPSCAPAKPREVRNSETCAPSARDFLVGEPSTNEPRRLGAFHGSFPPQVRRAISRPAAACSAPDRPVRTTARIWPSIYTSLLERGSSGWSVVVLYWQAGIDLIHSETSGV